MSEKIFINIWDDYFDDGYVPEGKIQETYAYVEAKVDDNTSKESLMLLENTINKIYNNNTPFEMSLYYYESAKRYPHLVGTEYDFMLYNRWQLGFKHMSHKERYSLIEKLQKQNLTYNQIPVEFYSES